MCKSSLYNNQSQPMEKLNNQLWTKLKLMSEKYFQGKSTIPKATIRQFFIEVFQKDQQGLNYILINYHRFNVGPNEPVSIVELGNFLLQFYCAQLALQRQHQAKNMSKGAQRLINFSQFYNLLSSSFQFLQVAFSQNTAFQIFQNANPHRDYITYQDYFKLFKKFAYDSNNGLIYLQNHSQKNSVQQLTQKNEEVENEQKNNANKPQTIFKRSYPTTKQLAAFIFKKIDKNNDGFISQTEYNDFMKTNGVQAKLKLPASKINSKQRVSQVFKPALTFKLFPGVNELSKSLIAYMS